MPRPFISFLTDFGPDSAAAICRGVMLSIAPDAAINDISHSVRKYQIRDGAFLLWIALVSMPVGVHVAVVDPGVGTARRPIGLLTGRGDVLIGPDNGLLPPAAERLGGLREARVLENRAWMLPKPTSTFHGRDIFSPMAAHLAIGGAFEEVGPVVDPATLVRLDAIEAVVHDGWLESSVGYVDSFGNLRIVGDPGDLAQAVGQLEPGRRFDVEFEPARLGGGRHIEHVPWARTFGDIALGQPLLYEDSFGRLAFADNQGNVASRIGVEPGAAVRIRPA
ncbi:MAG TPA: SAM-dependent chlorinase/fluorinase [Candidatus Limnocylindrales bacterium]|nr:SAM-dependent chlorinase/fluorinase [Candidatus Limnocylindrales bacterium]